MSQVVPCCRCWEDAEEAKRRRGQSFYTFTSTPVIYNLYRYNVPEKGDEAGRSGERFWE